MGIVTLGVGGILGGMGVRSEELCEEFCKELGVRCGAVHTGKGNGGNGQYKFDVGTADFALVGMRTDEELCVELCLRELRRGDEARANEGRTLSNVGVGTMGTMGIGVLDLLGVGRRGFREFVGGSAVVVGIGMSLEGAEVLVVRGEGMCIDGALKGGEAELGSVQGNHVGECVCACFWGLGSGCVGVLGIGTLDLGGALGGMGGCSEEFARSSACAAGLSTRARAEGTGSSILVSAPRTLCWSAWCSDVFGVGRYGA